MRERAVERVPQELRLQMQPGVFHRPFDIETLKRQRYLFENGLDPARPGIDDLACGRCRY